MKFPGVNLPGVQAEMNKFYDELAAIRSLLERLIEIHEEQK